MEIGKHSATEVGEVWSHSWADVQYKDRKFLKREKKREEQEGTGELAASKMSTVWK